METWRRKALEAFPELREELTGAGDTIAIGSAYSLWFELLPMVRAAHDDGDTDLLQRIYDYAHWSARHPSKEVWNPVAVAFLEHLFDTPRDVEDVLAVMEDTLNLPGPLSPAVFVSLPEEIKKTGETRRVSEARMREILAWLAGDVIEDVWALWQFRLEESDMDLLRRLLREQNRPLPEDRQLEPSD